MIAGRSGGALAALAGAALLAGALSSPALGSWHSTVVGAPSGIDVLGTFVASSAGGAAATSYNTVNVDAQANAGAFLATAPPGGTFGAAVPVPGMQEVLALGYSGSTLEILAATGLPGLPCCSMVVAIPYGAAYGFGGAQTIAAGAGGGATGQLVPLAGGRTLAVVDSPRRLWVSEAGANGRFAPARALGPPGVPPAALAAVATDGGGAIVAWTQGSRVVRAAFAGPGGGRWRERTLLTVARGRTVDGVQLVARPGGATLAWTDSHTDGGGTYRSTASAADLTGDRLGRRRALSAHREVAAGLTLAGDGSGDEVAAWNSCRTASGDCVVKAAVRGAPPRRGRGRRRGRLAAPWFGPPRVLGYIDGGASAQVAMAPDRDALLGWISGGRFVLSELLPHASRFGRAGALSGGLAGNATVGFGAGGLAVAAWTEGTFTTSVFGAVAR